jgi:hypothetical protein
MKTYRVIMLLLAGVFFSLPMYAGAQAIDDVEIVRRFDVCSRKVAALENEIKCMKQAANARTQGADALGPVGTAIHSRTQRAEDPWWFEYHNIQR